MRQEATRIQSNNKKRPKTLIIRVQRKPKGRLCHRFLHKLTQEKPSLPAVVIILPPHGLRQRTSHEEQPIQPGTYGPDQQPDLTEESQVALAAH